MSKKNLNIAEARSVVEATTPDLVPGLFRSDDPTDQVAQFKETLDLSPPGKCWVVCAPVDGKLIEEEAKYAAITGNGPTSEANARLFSVARPWLLHSFDRIEELERENARLRMLLNMPTRGA